MNVLVTMVGACIFVTITLVAIIAHVKLGMIWIVMVKHVLVSKVYFVDETIFLLAQVSTEIEETVISDPIPEFLE